MTGEATKDQPNAQARGRAASFLGPIALAALAFALFALTTLDALTRDAALLADRLRSESPATRAEATQIVVGREQALQEASAWISFAPLGPAALTVADPAPAGLTFADDRLVWTADHPRLADADGAPYGLRADVTQLAVATTLWALVVWAGAAVIAHGSARRGAVHAAPTTDEKAEPEPSKSSGTHDGMTGLATRTLYQGRLDADLAALAESKCDDLLLILVDADDFKFINDTYGHDAGDAVLIEIASRLGSVMESVGGHAARLGGDEFAAAARVNDGWPTAEAVGDALQARIAESFSFGGVKLTIKTSVGIACSSAVDAPQSIDASRLIKAADVALYAAKRAGKSQYRVFDEELNATMDRRAELIRALPKAIEVGDLRPVLQPRIELETGKLVGFEALSRWTWHGHAVSAGEFVALAEEIGIVDQLDVALFEKAVHAFAGIGASDKRLLRLTANMAPTTLLSENIIGRFVAIAKNAGVEPYQLAFEGDERLFGDDWPLLKVVLDGLQEAGFSIALDNFGVGASSISFLSKFPFNFVTIDRKFVNTLYEEPGNIIIFNHLNEMARDLGASIVAQGLETAETAEFVRHLGAQIGQGNLFTEPLELNDVPDFIANFVEEPVSSEDPNDGEAAIAI